MVVMRLERLCLDFFNCIVKLKPFELRMMTSKIESSQLGRSAMEAIEHTIASQNTMRNSRE